MIWTISIILVVSFYNGSCENHDFFLAKHYRSGNYFCVTNSSYALSWVDDKDDPDKLNHESTYLPSRTSINNADFVNNIWTENSSLFWKYSNGDPILDSRWEAMPIHKTEHVSNYGDLLKYYNILKITQKDFKIPISIRIKYEAHIFLCNGYKPSTSDCYWFMLQGYHGNVSALRKCKKTFLPETQGVWPQGDCKTHRTNVTHPDQQPPYFSRNMWSHFVISKQGDTLAFINQQHKTKPLLEWRDTKDPIIVTNLIIHSKIVNGLWKIHNVHFLYTEIAKEDVLLGPKITVTDKNSFCLSMFISMCSTCRLKLSLAKSNSVIADEEHFAMLTGWKEIKFITHNTTAGDQVKLLVSTYTTQPTNSFWAISKIRICKPNEVRGMELPQEGICQLMSPLNPIINYKNTLNTFSKEVLNSQCAEDSVGQFCVPCKWIFESCKQISICTNKKCACSAGYYRKYYYSAYQEECLSNCQGGYYGHGCNKTCGKCYYSNSCNHIHGTCEYSNYECIENYSGPKCDIPPAVIFTYPPNVYDISFTEAKVQVSNFEIQSNAGASNQTPTKYVIQYKATYDEDNEWNDTKEEFSFHTVAIVKLENLDPETMYSVRGVIIADNIQQISHLIPTFNFTTKCTDIEAKDISIKASNLTAVITLPKYSKYFCKLYRAYLFQQVVKQNFQNNTVYFTNLNPFTEYKLIVERNSNRFEKSFKTEEGIPFKINELSFESTSKTVTLNWETPQLNGNLKNFIIKYKRLYSKGCKTSYDLNNLAETRTEVNTNSITLSDLIPYSVYEVSVIAANTIFEGPAYTSTITTESSEKIFDDEVPHIANTNSSPYKARILLSQIKCEKLKGPLKYQVFINCTNEWCIYQIGNPKPIDFNYDKIEIDTDNNLTPFSDYDLKIKFCRSNMACITRTKGFKTQPIAPGKILDALVYTKNDTSFSIRWKPPFPPMGVLAEYMIKVKYKEDKQKSEKTEEIRPSSCKLWPELHCATISQLKTNKNYTIEVSARNQYPEIYGEAETLYKYTRREPSKAPYNLKLSWSLNNDLDLQWNHPNETNGDIKFFVISSYNETRVLQFNKKLNISKGSYNLTYSYKINALEFAPTTEYIISVFVNNGIDGETAQETILSPPDIPSLEKETEYSSTNDNISIKIFPAKPLGQSERYNLFVFFSKNFEKCNLNITCLEKSRTIFCDFSNELKPKPFSLTLGRTKERIHSNCKLNNIPIKPATTYSITLILFNAYKNESRYTLYSKIYKINGEKSYYLLILLLFPFSGIIFIIVCRFRKNYTNFNSEGSNNKVSLNLAELPSTKISAKTFYSQKSKHFIKEYSVGKIKQKYEVLLDSVATYISIDKYFFQHVTMECIASLKVKNCYILTTMPNKTEINEFWNMIWKEKILHIALLDDLQKINQCYNIYWPKNENDEMQFGNITIKYITCVQNENYIIRKFSLVKNNRAQKVEQIHLTSSLHKSNCLSSISFIHFFKTISKISIDHKLPLLIQSSSKLDIAGFALLCDVSIRLAKKENNLDILKNLEEIVKGIPEVMINFDQCILAHSVILDTLLHIDTSLVCSDLDLNQKTLYPAEETEAQIEYLKDTIQFDKIQLQQEKDHTYCNAICSNQDDAVALYQITEKDILYDTIIVDSVNNDKKFLLSSQPTEDRLDDFILFLQQTKITLILSFDHNVTLWPSHLRPILRSKDISLQYVDKERTQNYDWITIQLSNEKLPDNNFTIAILSMKHWPSQYGYFPKVDSFVNFCIETKGMVKQNDKVLVTCRDGITASGIFVAMYYNMEKIGSEGISDVCSTVRQIRRHCEHFISDNGQYQFLLDATHSYLKESSLYEIK